MQMNHNQICIALTDRLLISENVEATFLSLWNHAMHDHLTAASLNTIRHLLPYIAL